jgi:predicted amidohydrolase
VDKIVEGLKVALVHASVQWGEKEKNLARLLDLNEKAAGAGARVIVNTELAATGYSFAGRIGIGPGRPAGIVYDGGNFRIRAG